MNLEHPPQSALEWLNRMLAYIHKLEAENIRLDEFIRSRPTGTKIQREQQILKRMETAETEVIKLRKALTEIRDLPKDKETHTILTMREIARCALAGESYLGFQIETR